MKNIVFYLSILTILVAFPVVKVKATSIKKSVNSNKKIRLKGVVVKYNRKTAVIIQKNGTRLKVNKKDVPKNYRIKTDRIIAVEYNTDDFLKHMVKKSTKKNSKVKKRRKVLRKRKNKK